MQCFQQVLRSLSELPAIAEKLKDKLEDVQKGGEASGGEILTPH